MAIEKLRLWDNGRELMISMQQKLEPGGNPAAGAQQEPAPDETLFEGEYEAPAKPGFLWYYFVMRAGTQTYYYGNNEEKLGGEGRLAAEEPSSFQITVYQELQVPEWYKRGAMYQVFVDRFYQVFEPDVTLYPRKNALLHANWSDRPLYIKDAAGRVTDWDFFGGNLQGVIEKLPYFRELGVSILYFNPIFDTPSNHKYDTADYHRIDPMYGDEEVF